MRTWLQGQRKRTVVTLISWGNGCAHIVGLMAGGHHVGKELVRGISQCVVLLVREVLSDDA